MYMKLFFLYFILIIKKIQGNHFDGGVISWMPLTKNASTSPIQIMITQTYTYDLGFVNCSVGNIIDTKKAYGFNFSLWCTSNCGASSAGYNAPPVLGYCNGLNPALGVAFTQRSDIVNLTGNNYFIISQ